MAVFAKLVSVLTLLPALVAGVTVPGADTPLFYLVATGPDTAGVNFLVRRSSLLSTLHLAKLTVARCASLSLYDFMEGALTIALFLREMGLLGSSSSPKAFLFPSTPRDQHYIPDQLSIPSSLPTGAAPMVLWDSCKVLALINAHDIPPSKFSPTQRTHNWEPN